MRYFFLICITLLNIRCSDDMRRPEVIDSLRIIGAEASPAIMAIGTASTQVKFIVAAPSDNNISATATRDEEASFLKNPITLTLQGALSEVDTVGPIKIYEQNATAALSTGLPTNDAGETVFRYATDFSDETETIKAVGDLFWLDSNDDALTLTAPSISIEAPADNSSHEAGDDIDLKAMLTNQGNEDVRISWFVTGGEVENRRAAETTWKTDDIESGATHAALVTVRGLTTRSLSYQYITVQF